MEEKRKMLSSRFRSRTWWLRTTLIRRKRRNFGERGREKEREDEKERMREKADEKKRK